jgi:hypothetical protein
MPLSAQDTPDHALIVPSCRYDNMKPAVARVLKGRDRAETERFVELRSQRP